MFSFDFDVFLAYASEDKKRAKSLKKELERLTLKVFKADVSVPPGTDWKKVVDGGLRSSQHLLILCSEHAVASKHVRYEYKTFFNDCFQPANGSDEPERKMYVLLGGMSSKKLPNWLRKTQYARTRDDLINDLMKVTAAERKRLLDDEIGSLEEQLESVRERVQEAQGFYRYDRFWSGHAVHDRVHIFTCGRDAGSTAALEPSAEDPGRPDDPTGAAVGRKGRTNIDLWDYRSVFDLTHFFASNYPNTRTVIEDPISKLHDADLLLPQRLANRMSRMRGMLMDKNCIIIGSPDVSDFAEIILAELHGMDPYTDKRTKRRGFAIMKKKKLAKSSFYWGLEGDEEEGVAEIIEPGAFGEGDYEYFPHKPPTSKKPTGTMYGLMVVADNPFTGDDEEVAKRGDKTTRGTEAPTPRIVILSGFSGVATNAVAKILTDPKWIEAFFELDTAYVNLDRNVEVLIEVDYVAGRGDDSRDTREIESIRFRGLAEI